MGPRAGQAWGQRQAGLWGSVLLLGGLSIRVMVAGTLDRPRAPQQPSRPWSLGWGPARWAGARFLLGPQKELMDAKGRRASLCPALPHLGGCRAPGGIRSTGPGTLPVSPSALRWAWALGAHSREQPLRGRAQGPGWHSVLEDGPLCGGGEEPRTDHRECPPCPGLQSPSPDAGITARWALGRGSGFRDKGRKEGSAGHTTRRPAVLPAEEGSWGQLGFRGPDAAPPPRFCPQKMKEQAQLFSKDIRQIDLDVNRTFRNHVMFWDRYGIR